MVQPLSNLNTGDLKPTEISFPDNSKVLITTWKAILVEVARWLISNNLLHASHCPIPIKDGSKRYLISASSSTHGTGKPFRTESHKVYKIKQGGDNFYITANYEGKDLIKYTQRIIKLVGQDPVQFKVRLP